MIEGNIASSKGDDGRKPPGKRKLPDSRRRLRPFCPKCGARLESAQVDEDGMAGSTARGAYACGSKFLAWAEGPQEPACVRLCERPEETPVPNFTEEVEGREARHTLTREEFEECREFLSEMNFDDDDD